MRFIIAALSFVYRTCFYLFISRTLSASDRQNVQTQDVLVLNIICNAEDHSDPDILQDVIAFSLILTLTRVEGNAVVPQS